MESFEVSAIFEFFVLFSGIGGSGLIDSNGVINDQIDRDDGVDLIGITTKSGDGISHGSEIDDSGDTSEILKDNSGGKERNIQILVGGVFPVKDSFNISSLEFEFVAVSDGAFEEDSDRVREFFWGKRSEMRDKRIKLPTLASLRSGRE